MSWYRSQEMEYISIVVNRQRAKECMERLGDLGVMQFRDVRSMNTLPSGALLLATTIGRVSCSFIVMLMHF